MKKMKMKTAYKILGIAIVIIAAVSCKKNEISSSQLLTLSNLTDTIPESGGTVTLAFNSTAAWSVDTLGIGWLHLSQTSGASGAASIDLTAAKNTSGARRTVVLNVNSDNGQRRRITVLQDAIIYPSYNTSSIAPDATGMSSTASQIANNITYGWNFYNTMETPAGQSWGPPPITQQQMDMLKANGINAVRIPIRYDGHFINTKTMQIDPVWLARVKEVVQYAINDGMYVTINTHHQDPDCTITGAKQDSANAKHKATWEQIATTMRDFDEHLMFASTNEPNANDAPTTVTLMRYHQTFINAVRATGGKNTYRTLIIQSPSTSVDLANAYLDPTNEYKTPTLPTDPTPHKMMIEFHYYSPSQFCILSGDASWGKELYFWGKNYHTTNPLFLDRNCTYNEEAYVDSIFHAVKVRFADKGIPLFMGEYAPQYHAGRLTGYKADSLRALASGTHFTAYIAEQAKANGVIPFLWAGIFNRPGGAAAYVGDQVTLDSVKAAVNRGVDKYGKGGAKFH